MCCFSQLRVDIDEGKESWRSETGIEAFANSSLLVIEEVRVSIGKT